MVDVVPSNAAGNNNGVHLALSTHVLHILVIISMRMVVCGCARTRAIRCGPDGWVDQMGVTVHRNVRKKIKRTKSDFSLKHENSAARNKPAIR